MKMKPIRITERDIENIVKKVLQEQVQQQPAPAQQQPASGGECVRQGQFLRNCTKRYNNLQEGMIVVSPEGMVSISVGGGAYLRLDPFVPAYSYPTAQMRDNLKSTDLNEKNVLDFIVNSGVPNKTLLAVLNDSEIQQKNKTVQYVRTTIKNMGTTQAFIQKAASNPELRGNENLKVAAEEIVKAITGK